MNYLEISILLFFILFLILFYISNYIYNKFIIDQKNIEDEGFYTDSNFDCASYYKRYPDIKKNWYYGRGCKWALKHWNDHGKREGRYPGTMGPEVLAAAKNAKTKLEGDIKNNKARYNALKEQNDNAINRMNNDIKEINKWEKKRENKYAHNYNQLNKLNHYTRMQERRIPAMRHSLLSANGDPRPGKNPGHSNSYANKMIGLKNNFNQLDNAINEFNNNDQKLSDSISELAEKAK
jgi:hypothetical protein